MCVRLSVCICVCVLRTNRKEEKKIVFSVSVSSLSLFVSLPLSLCANSLSMLSLYLSSFSIELPSRRHPSATGDCLQPKPPLLHFSLRRLSAVERTTTPVDTGEGPVPQWPRSDASPLPDKTTAAHQRAIHPTAPSISAASHHCCFTGGDD